VRSIGGCELLLASVTKPRWTSDPPRTPPGWLRAPARFGHQAEVDLGSTQDASRVVASSCSLRSPHRGGPRTHPGRFPVVASSCSLRSPSRGGPRTHPGLLPVPRWGVGEKTVRPQGVARASSIFPFVPFLLRVSLFSPWRLRRLRSRQCALKEPPRNGRSDSARRARAGGGRCTPACRRDPPPGSRRGRRTGGTANRSTGPDNRRRGCPGRAG